MISLENIDENIRTEDLKNFVKSDAFKSLIAQYYPDKSKRDQFCEGLQGILDDKNSKKSFILLLTEIKNNEELKGSLESLEEDIQIRKERQVPPSEATTFGKFKTDFGKNIFPSMKSSMSLYGVLTAEKTEGNRSMRSRFLDALLTTNLRFSKDDKDRPNKFNLLRLLNPVTYVQQALLATRALLMSILDAPFPLQNIQPISLPRQIIKYIFTLPFTAAIALLDPLARIDIYAKAAINGARNSFKQDSENKNAMIPDDNSRLMTNSDTESMSSDDEVAAPQSQRKDKHQYGDIEAGFNGTSVIISSLAKSDGRDASLPAAKKSEDPAVLEIKAPQKNENVKNTSASGKSMGVEAENMNRRRYP